MDEDVKEEIGAMEIFSPPEGDEMYEAVQGALDWGALRHKNDGRGRWRIMGP